MRVRVILFIGIAFSIVSCGGKRDSVGNTPEERPSNQYAQRDNSVPKYNPFQCVGLDEANWELIGPHSYIDSRAQWHGYVWTILGDERNYPSHPVKHTLVGTAGSGIWRFEETQNSKFEWVCKTDDLNLLGLRINEIVRNPCYPDQVFAATGTNEPNNTTYGTGIIFSDDNGDTWRQLPNRIAKLSYNHEVLRIIPDKFSSCNGRNMNYYVLSKEFKEITLGYVSSKGYEMCNLPPLEKDFYFIYDIEMVGQNSLLVSTRNPYGLDAELFFSGNKGKSWSKITSRLPEFPYSSNPPEGCNKCAHSNGCFCRPGKMSISEESNGRVFLYCDNQMIYESTNRGGSWELLPIEKLSRVDNNKIDIAHSAKTGILYFGGIQPWLYIDGNKYSYKQGHDDVRDYYFLGFDPETNEELVLLANDGGVSLVKVNTKTYDTRWEDVCGDSFPITQLWGIGVAQSKEEEYVIGVMHCNSFHYDGENWEKIGGGDGGGCLIDPFNKTRYYATGNANLTQYTSERKKAIFRNNKWFLGSPLKLHPADANLIYFGMNKGRGSDCGSKSYAKLVMYHDESGKKEEKPIRNCGFNVVESIGLSYSNPNLLLIGDGERNGNKTGKLLKSEDNGSTWEDLSETEVFLNDGQSEKIHEVVKWRKINDILINPYNEREIYLCISNHGEKDGRPKAQYKRVLRSKNGGTSWTDYSLGLPHISANCFLYEHGSNDRIFLGTDWGVYYTDRSVNGWKCFNGGLPNCIITEMEINYCRNELVIGTYGRGLWKTPLLLPKVENEMVIKRDQTWTSDKVILSNIRINKNKTLNVQGQLKFASGCNILLEKNAKILIDEVNISCLCEDSSCGQIIREN